VDWGALGQAIKDSTRLVLIQRFVATLASCLSIADIEKIVHIVKQHNPTPFALWITATASLLKTANRLP